MNSETVIQKNPKFRKFPLRRCQGSRIFIPIICITSRRSGSITPLIFPTTMNCEIIFQMCWQVLSPKRKRLVELLRSQNAHLNSSSEYESLLATLGNENALAVVTGQQVGLFCGPLYTLFKTDQCDQACSGVKREISRYLNLCLCSGLKVTTMTLKNRIIFI